MKLIKRLASAAIAVAMIASISTVAFAGALNFPATSYSFYANKATITQGTTSFKVSFGIVDKAGADIDIPNNPSTDVANYVGVDSFAYAKLSAEAVAAGIKATDIESSVATIVDPCFYIEGEGNEGDLFGASFAFDKPSFVLNAETPLFTVTFTAPADVALGTYKLLDADDYTYCLALMDKDSKLSGSVVWKDTDFVTVEAAEPTEDKTITTETADNGALQFKYGADVEDANKTLAGKYIVMGATAPAESLTKNSRVVVTYDDGNSESTLNKSVEYGTTIFEHLDIQGEGEVNTNEIKFGIVYTDARYQAANFSFTIK